MSRSRAIQSMTGYGRASRRTSAGRLSVELRSSNHRYLEIEQRLPATLSPLQGRLAGCVRDHLRRGRVELVVALHTDADERWGVELNEPLLERYYRALRALKARFGLKGQVTLDHLLGLPQALTVSEKRAPPERFWEPTRHTVEAALRELVHARIREGAKLVADLRRQLGAIERHVRAVKHRLPKALAQQRSRLRQRLAELLGPDSAVSPSHLEQAAALAKEADIHEELVRLESHLAYVRQTLAGGEAVGKRLDFIAQELMRETNTMGAKVNDAQAAQHVVDIKGCVEKIREQVQNLE